MREGFGVLILTHGRPDKVHTARSLASHGYTGPIWYVIDNEDKTAEEYRRRFGEDRVVMFDKAAVAQTFDTADLSDERRTIVYARNASFDIARSLGLRWFVQLDDDYDQWLYRYQNGSRLSGTRIRNLDALFEAMLDFLEESGVLTVALSQGGDHVMGINGAFAKGILRKAMNSFFVRTDRPIGFVGRINEDVNTYVTKGSRGELFLTVTSAMLHQKETQQQAGGMTEVYLASGTYVKSWYTVLMAPSCVTVQRLTGVGGRWHHQVAWNNAVPKILSERYRR